MPDPSEHRKLWTVPTYLPYVQPPILKAERKIGYKLPEEYLALLRIQNGGYIRYTLQEAVHEMIWGIGPHYPSLTDDGWKDGLDGFEIDLAAMLPFDGDGHWYLCLDYRRNKITPEVTFVDVECESETPVTGSFAEYLGVLVPDCAESNFFVPAGDVTAIRDVLAAQLRLGFEEQSARAHGYPIYRARGGSEANPEWMWISANLAPRGFVREDDSRYEELKDAMPGMACRFGEIPESAVLVSATEVLRPKLVAVCKQQGIDLRPLAEYLI